MRGVLLYSMNAEPTIVCPTCKSEIKLTESLAAPLIESTRLAYERRIADKDAEVATKQADLKQQAEAIERAKATLDEQVAEKLTVERAKLIETEAKRLKLELGQELAQRASEVANLEAIVKAKDEKLTEAQNAQAEIKKKERELEDAQRALNLTVETKVNEGLDTVREQAKKEAQEEQKLAIAERDTKLAGMQNQIEELKRRAEQGSQQLQGEVMELQLEGLLSAKFPFDTFAPVPKGEHGGDVLHRVNGPMGQLCGTILWESKRTKNWTDSWLVKLRDDQRAAKADIAVIVSQALPKDCDTFALVDGVWVVHPRCAFPMAVTLRQTLIEVATARQAADGQQTKMELVYQYLTGPRFRHRVQAMVEVFSTMQEDLDKERKAIMKQWDKRRTQIDRVVQATVGMYGDLQGIAGKTLQEIEGIDIKSLESSSENI
jgi:hypothetical protein